MVARCALALVLAGCGGHSDAADITLEITDGSQPAVRTHDGRVQVGFPARPKLDPRPDMQVAVSETPDFSFKLIAVPIDYDASSDVPRLYDEVRRSSWFAAGVATAKVTRDDVLLLGDQVARRIRIEMPDAGGKLYAIDEWLVYVPWEHAVFAVVASHADDAAGAATARAEQLIATLAITRPSHGH